MNINFGNDFFDGLSAIDAAQTSADLPGILQATASKAGFDSFAYLDGRAETSVGGRIITTVAPAWQETYARENLAAHDPCVRRVAESNSPFFWSDIVLPEDDRRPDLSRMTMTAARDMGYYDGLVMPLHMADANGVRMLSSLSLFWADGSEDVRRVIGPRGPSVIKMLAAAWAEKLSDLGEAEAKPGQSPAKVLTGLFGRPPKLTSREVDVLSWAAKGKTADETSVILGLGRETVHTHLSNACRKLHASNKTHAVAMAVHRRLIRP